jgi:hypothetical protein
LGTEPDAAFADKDDVWSSRWAGFENSQYQHAADRAPARAQSASLRLALDRIADDPMHFARKSLWEAGHLWTLDSFLLRHLRNGWFGKGAPDWLLPISVLISASFGLFLLSLGLLGLAGHPATPLRSFTIIALAHATLLFGLTFSLSRYALPLRPLLAVFAAWAVSGPGAFRVRFEAMGNSSAKRLLLSLVFLALASVWIRDLPLLLDNLVNGGARFLFKSIP